MTKSPYAPIVLLFISLVLAATSIALKSMFVIAGATGLVITWFLCIDRLIAAQELPTPAKLLFTAAIIGVPVFMSVAMG